MTALAFAVSDWGRMGLSMVFFWIAFVGIVILGVAALVGHGDHDVEHDHDVGHDHDTEHGTTGNLSFFSFRVLMMFIVGFGCFGFFGARGGYEVAGSCLVGVGGGLIFGLLTWTIMNYLYKHQGTSAVNTQRLIGCEGVVTIPISQVGVGEIVCRVDGSQVWLPAKTTGQAKLPVNTRVKITDSFGASVMVEPIA